MDDLSKDAWEEWGDELYGPGARDLKVDLRIKYEDAQRQVTFRTVTVERFVRTSDTGGMMIAYCHLRQARRTFRFWRIQFAADLQNAQPITDVGQWLDTRYAESPLGQRDEFIVQHNGALGALLFVAKADEAFRAKERAVLAAFCIETGGATDALAQMVVAFVSGWPIPSKVKFGQDLRSMLERPVAYRQAVLRTAESVVASDKTVRENETRALGRMSKELGLAS